MLITCPKCSAKYKIPQEINLTDGRKIQCSACQNIFVFHPELKMKTFETTSLVPPDDAVLSVKTKTEKITLKTPEISISNEKKVLPEVFCPVQVQKTSSSIPYFWILLCTILLIGFMAMAWLYRDLLLNRSLLMPSIPVIEHVHQKKLVSAPPKVPKKVVPQVMENDKIVVSQVQELPAVTEKILPPVVQQMPSVQSVRFRKTPTGDAVLIEGNLKNTTQEVLSVPEKIYALAYNTKGDLAFEKEIYLPSGVLYPDMEQPFFGTYAPITEEIQWVDVVLKK